MPATLAPYHVEAFNTAVGQTVGGIRDWTAATAAGVK